MAEKWPNFYRLTGDFEGRVICCIHPDAPDEKLRASGSRILRLPEVIVNVPAAVTVADAFKCSYVRDIHIGRLVVRRLTDPAGKLPKAVIKENSWDSNYCCANVTVDEADLEEGDQNAVTWKGGSTNFHVKKLVVHGKGGHCDGEFGGYSEQSKLESRTFTIDRVDCDDGRPFRYRRAYAQDVTIRAGNVKYQWLMSLLVRWYVKSKL